MYYLQDRGCWGGADRFPLGQGRKTAPATGVENAHLKAKAVLQKWPRSPGIYEPPLMTSWLSSKAARHSEWAKYNQSFHNKVLIVSHIAAPKLKLLNHVHRKLVHNPVTQDKSFYEAAFV